MCLVSLYCLVGQAQFQIHVCGQMQTDRQNPEARMTVRHGPGHRIKDQAGLRRKSDIELQKKSNTPSQSMEQNDLRTMYLTLGTILFYFRASPQIWSALVQLSKDKLTTIVSRNMVTNTSEMKHIDQSWTCGNQYQL